MALFGVFFWVQIDIELRARDLDRKSNFLASWLGFHRKGTRTHTREKGGNLSEGCSKTAPDGFSKP